MFWSKKRSEWELKVDICCSQHLEEPQWDIVMDLTDALNSDNARAKRVLAHLRRVLERSISQSTDNQQLKNCLDVIDSLTRNGNDNIISVIHSSFLLPLSKLALSEDKSNSAKLKSLLQSSENKKNCRDRVLELILDWQTSDINQIKYPHFRTTFIDLKLNGAPFNKIIAEKKRIEEELKKEQEQINNNNNNEAQRGKEEKEEYEDEPKYNNPWNNKNVDFGRWYKSKLKADLSKLIDMIVMTQDIIAMRNVTDAELMTQELREANKRLISIMLRTADPPAIDCLMQLVTINASLLDCYKKLKNGQKFIVPGVSRQFLHILIKFL